MLRYDNEYATLIFEYFLMRTRFQYFKCGDFLPAADILCEKFKVSDQTVQSALQRLQAEGYISMGTGKRSKVIFQQSELERKEYAIRFFSQRKDAYYDFKRSTELTSIPLLVECFRRMDNSDFAFLVGFAERATPLDLIRFYIYTFQKMNNPLVMNLFWEAAIFQGFPLLDLKEIQDLYDQPSIQKQLAELIALGRRKEWDLLRDSFLIFQRRTIDGAIRFIDQQVQGFPEEEQQAFVWRIYRDRPQICYSLLVRVLYEIYMGEYQNTKFLPSYEKMARRYGVSVSTMRRTTSLLNRLGVARTINGKGTRLYSISEISAQPDVSCPAIRRNLAFFFQAHELIIYSCEEALHTMFSALGPEEKQKLIEELNAYLDHNRCDLTLWRLIVAIIRHSPFQSVREIYAKIFGLFLWGYPLISSGAANPDFCQMTAWLTKSAVTYLEKNEYSQCAACMKTFLTREFPLTEKHLRGLGLSQEELRKSQSISFLLTDEPDWSE